MEYTYRRCQNVLGKGRCIYISRNSISMEAFVFTTAFLLTTRISSMRGVGGCYIRHKYFYNREHDCVVAICHIFVGSVREIQKNSFLFSTYLVKDFQACALCCLQPPVLDLGSAMTSLNSVQKYVKTLKKCCHSHMTVLLSRAHDAAAAVGN